MNIDKLTKKIQKQVDSGKYKPESVSEFKSILTKLAFIQKNEISFSGSDAAKKISESVITDINGNTHTFDFKDIAYNSTSLSISLCDAGNWVGRDGDERLSDPSSIAIEDEIKRILPGCTVDEGETHLADVSFEISLPYSY